MRVVVDVTILVSCPVAYLDIKGVNLPVLQPDSYLSAGGLGGYFVIKFMVLSNPE
jgi:hypothetical protein